MNCKEDLEEEVEFWSDYISNWKVKHNEPIPDRAKQLLNNALLKLEGQYPVDSQNLILQVNKNTIH